MLLKHYTCKKIKILYISIFFKNEIEQIWTRKKLDIDFTIFIWDDFIFFLLNQIDDKQNRDFMIMIHFTDLTQYQNQTIQFFLIVYNEMYYELLSDQKQQKTQLFFIKLYLWENKQTSWKLQKKLFYWELNYDVFIEYKTLHEKRKHNLESKWAIL